MGYIRSNIDYYMNQGMSEKQARIKCRVDKLMHGKDPGVCNPMKARDYQEDLDEATRLAEMMEDDNDD